MSPPAHGLPNARGLPEQHHPWRRELIAAALILAAIFTGWHVIPALAVKDNPPIACQLAGGRWNPWDGWTCR